MNAYSEFSDKMFIAERFANLHGAKNRLALRLSVLALIDRVNESE